MVAARGDRVVLRTETTVGGGLVLDPSPPRGLDAERLALLETGEPEAIVRALASEPVTAASLQARGLLAPAELAQGLAALEQAGDWYFTPEWLEELRASARERLARPSGRVAARSRAAARGAGPARAVGAVGRAASSRGAP